VADTPAIGYLQENNRFKAGNPGRPKGAKNKLGTDIRHLAVRLLTSKAYLASLVHRLHAGKAPHMEVLLAHYAFGKPKERIELTTHDVTTLEVLLVAARDNGNGNHGHSGPDDNGTSGGPVTIDVTPTNPAPDS
jgi:hypothetical protein